MVSRVYSIEKVKAEILSAGPGRPAALSISVEGWVPTSGWSKPDLGPWIYIDPPKDGLLDLDFVAEPPTGYVLQVFTRIGVMRSFPVPDWVKGVRVHSSTNVVEAPASEAAIPASVSLLGEGLPLPWPFPWWVPGARK